MTATRTQASQFEQLMSAAVAAREIAPLKVPRRLPAPAEPSDLPMRAPIAGPTVWNAASIRESDYLIELDADSAVEIGRVRDTLVAQGKTLRNVTAADFRMPAVARIAAKIHDRIYRGVGFSLVRGLPFAGWSDDDAAMLYWGIGTYLGTPLPQNRQGDRVYLVTNAGKGYTEYGVRGSRTNTDLVFHTDSASAFADSVPDILGLLCLRGAASGGRSRMVSGHTVYNQLLAEAPELLAELHRPFFFDRSAEAQGAEDPLSTAPVFTLAGSQVRVRYNRFWIELGHRIAGLDLSARQRAALVAMDAALESPENVHEFDLQPGDVYFNFNHTTLHNRTAFTDFAEPGKRRCLVRLWLAMREQDA